MMEHGDSYLPDHLGLYTRRSWPLDCALWSGRSSFRHRVAVAGVSIGISNFLRVKLVNEAASGKNKVAPNGCISLNVLDR